MRELSQCIRGRPLPGSKNNQRQNSEAEICRAGWRNIKEATLADLVSGEEEAAGGLEVRYVMGWIG